MSNGELYTIITNKAAKGSKDCLVAIVCDTKADAVNAVLDKIPDEELNKIEEVTLDMSESMHKIGLSSKILCFKYKCRFVLVRKVGKFPLSGVLFLSLFECANSIEKNGFYL